MEKLIRARTHMIMDNPFFGSLTMRLSLEADASVDVMRTDGKTLLYNPEAVGEMSLDQTKGTLAHEALHIALRHHLRMGGRDPKLWNRAADYVVNAILVEQEQAKYGTGNPLEILKRILPGGVLYDAEFRDKSAEEVYSILDRNQQGDQQRKQGDSPQSGGQPGQDQPGKSDLGGPGEIEEYPGKDGGRATDSELAQAEAETKIMVRQAAQQAKAAGKLPAGIARMVVEILEPKVDWRDALRDFCQSSGRGDYSWAMPNRRFVGMGLHLPSLHSQTDLGTIVIALDTSGSVSQRWLDQFLGEVNAILGEFDADIWLLPVDKVVHGPRRYGKFDLPIRAEVCGGGGTSFRPPFEWVAENGVTPDALVYLTDGECGDYPDEPYYPVLWVTCGNRMDDAPFGQVVKIQEGDD